MLLFRWNLPTDLSIVDLVLILLLLLLRIAGESGLLRFRRQLPAFAGLAVQLCAEAVRWSRRVLSYSPGIDAFRTALVQAFWKRYLQRTPSTISGMGRRSPPSSSTGSLPVVLRHARGRADTLDTGGAIGPLFHAQDRLFVLSDAPFCPAMNLYSSNALDQASIRKFADYPLKLRISSTLVVGPMAPDLARGSRATNQRSNTVRMMMMLQPFKHERLQLVRGAAIPTDAEQSEETLPPAVPLSPYHGTAGSTPSPSSPPPSTEIYDTSKQLLRKNHGRAKTPARGIGLLASLTSRRGDLPGLRVGRDRSPTRRRLSPSKPTSPRAAPSATGLPLSRGWEEGIAGSTVSAVGGGGGVRNDSIDAVRECFGMPYPSVIRRTCSLTRASRGGRDVMCRFCSLPLKQNRIG